MIEKQVTLPELALVAGTRVVLGAGLGLLFAGRLSAGERRTLGWTLAAIGALTTIPLAIEILGKREAASHAEQPRSAEQPREAIGATS